MNGNNEGEILIYQAEDGSAVTEVRLEAETIWLTQAQLVVLFGRDQSVISRHIGNVFREGELTRKNSMQKMHIANSDKPVDFYSLDVIISVGYRVKSKQGTRFRQWANQVLKEYLTRGYALNEKKLQEQTQKFSDLHNTISLLEKTLAHQAIGEDEAKGLLKVISDYAYALTTLDRFDHESLAIENTSGAVSDFLLDYDQAIQIAHSMKGEFNGLFGLEKDQGFKSALATIYQTFDDQEVYPSVEEKAAHLFKGA